MATAIAVYTKEGKCVRRCDSACHNAKHDNCTCVCGGANHGKSQKHVEENTRELKDEWIRNAREEMPTGGFVRVTDNLLPQQVRLL